MGEKGLDANHATIMRELKDDNPSAPNRYRARADKDKTEHGNSLRKRDTEALGVAQREIEIDLDGSSARVNRDW